jgi:hypothetical protein
MRPSEVVTAEEITPENSAVELLVRQYKIYSEIYPALRQINELLIDLEFKVK